MRQYVRWQYILVLSALVLLAPEVVRGQSSSHDSIAVAAKKSLAKDQIDCVRIPLGEADDYKPCIAQLPSGELLLTAFHQHKKDGNKVLEQNLLFRSKDDGKTWSGPEKLDLLGREPYLTVLNDGTIFMTGHLLANDVRNTHDYTHGYLHCSTDAGKTWESIRIESEGIKPKASNHTTRNVLQLADGTLLLGVDYDGGEGPYLMWRSKDNGKTWDKTGKCQPKDFKSQYGFFGGETWLWQARSGKIWALVRVDSNELPIKDRPIKAGNDQADHFILFSSADSGKTFDRIRDFGDYGEMYMSILRMKDQRLLLTFTVRDLKPPLGVRALAGSETEDGFEFDFTKDRLMLDTSTPIDKSQGGGFGPTVQLKDGTLVTSYSYRDKDDKTQLEVVRWKMPEPVSSKPTKPNVLIILADDMGYSDAGCYGSEIATPNLDGLAKNGLRFTQFYNTARCWPSRAAILTGYYAQQVRRDSIPGIKSGGQGTRPGWAKLLPEMLRPLGYRAYHSGKWHVDGRPLQNGFDHSYSLEDHDRHFAPQRHTEDDKPLPPVDPKAGYYTSTAIADHAIKCLKEHADKFAEKPFLEYLAFTAPHFPLHAPAEDIARYRKKYLDGWDAMRDERWQRMKNLKIGGTSLAAIERDQGPPYPFPEAIKKLGPNEVNRPLAWKDLNAEQREFQANKMAIHAAMVDRMDREIGRVLDQLRTMGALDNTLVFFMSDNGASAEMMVRGDGHDPNAAPGSSATYLSIGPGWSSLANTPFRRHKTWVHEGGISTPLIVHWPKGIAARGEVRNSPGHLIDLVPTILEATGGKVLDKWDGKPVPSAPGKSLLPAFAKDETVVRNSLWWLHEGNRALRVGDWKIVAAGKDNPWELYDLSTDRAESKNLAAEKPEKVRELAGMWTKQLEEYTALALKDATPEMKAKAKK
ncbi:MAG: hypothetical protein EXS09_19380 [Gemmataceae bacterium]|nr:hypothetical protein [Gemmataceae bacterium]